MKRVSIYLVVFLFANALTAQTQKPTIKPADFKRLQELEVLIADLARRAVQDTLVNTRLVANGQMIPLIKEALTIPNSFNYAFTKIENISIQQPQDGTFRILTWQLYINDDEYKYFGYVQLNRPKPPIIELSDASQNLKDSDKESLSPDRWFGAVYYNLKEFKTNDGMKYLLFGYNANDKNEKIKLLDVLVLRGGQVRFGSPVLEVADIQGVRKQKLHRLILSYSAEATMRLNFDPEMNIIIHDHLEQMASKTSSLPFTYVPDGTYEAFQLQKDGMWTHVDKLANTEMKTAPRPMPTLNSRNRPKDAKANAQQVVWPEDAKNRPIKN